MRSRNRKRRPFDRLKFLALLLAAQVLCLLLWGLTWPNAHSPVELSFVVPQNEVRPWQTIVTEFEQDHPNIRIDLVTNPGGDFTTDEREIIYTADFQTNVAQYDLVYMDLVWPLLKFAEEDYLRDLNDYVKRDGVDLSGFLDRELLAGQVDNHLYRLPMRSDVGVLYYRPDLLDQLGVGLPRTLAELSQSGERLETAGKVGYLWQGSRYEGLVANFVEVLAGAGGTWIEPGTGKVGLDTPMAIAAATQLQQLIQEGLSPGEVITYTEEDSLQRFLQGKAVFLRGWPYFWAEFQRSELADKVEIAPPFSLADGPGIGCRGGWGFGIPTNSSHPDEAWEAIKYFTSAAAQKEFVLESGFLPSRTALFDDPDIVAKYPQMPEILDYLDNASVFRPAIKNYGAASEILQAALSDILRGEQSAKAAMAQAQIKTEALLQES